MKKQRALLELPLDLSINLAPVDMNNIDSLQQALREHEQMLLQGAKDRLIFGLKKIFEQTYKEFRRFFSNSSFSSSNIVEEANKIETLDDVLTKLVDGITNISNFSTSVH